MRSAATDSGGLRCYQQKLVGHVLKHFECDPGIIVAERTGRGKSLIASAIMAALARAKVESTQQPLRVGLLAPNANVLENWVGDEGLLRNALENPEHPTHLWRDHAARWSLHASDRWLEKPRAPELEIAAHHYGFGITYNYATWSKNKAGLRAQARRFLGRPPCERLDLLIIDEAHQLKSSRTGRARAIRALFGNADSPLPVDRVLLLTATPFQLRAAPELARLIELLRFPARTGVGDFQACARDFAGPALQRRFTRYEQAMSRWLLLKLGKYDGHDALEDARAATQDVERLLRMFIVRADDRRAYIHIRYGHSDPRRGAAVPDAAAGLEIEDPNERLLFLAWDGSIASRTTFVATEQQTLSSSARALRGRHSGGVKTSAVERSRTPLAPPGVQTAFAELARALTRDVDPDHVKVLATRDAVLQRLSEDPEHRPVLVFAERLETLQQLRELLATRLPSGSVEIVDGSIDSHVRDELLARFRGDSKSARVHALLASRVAEMGLDIDGPRDKHDIWLIHHDFPWNPAMVDQRNGRVCRPAKGTEDAQSDVWISYPFIRDTVDERIFKRMVLRQALAEMLLGTDDVARALRLTNLDNLEAASLDLVMGPELRALTPNLTPGQSREAAVSEPCVDLSDTKSRPPWCPIELVDLLGQTLAALPASVVERIHALVSERSFTSWTRADALFIRVDLVGRTQTVALFRREQLVIALSIADNDAAADKLPEALRANASPGVAGLALHRRSEGQPYLVARAANLIDTLDDNELRRLVLETARRADEWEARYHGEDRW